MSAVWSVIVGIDIGLTCTGVAIYYNAPDGRFIVLQQWPGTEDRTTSKVPTRLTYKAGEVDIHSWGFSCPELGNLGPGMAIKDMFKFYLDTYFVKQKFLRASENAPKLKDVKSWYAHFLGALHNHIMHYLQEQLIIDVHLTTIEFVFGIPTIWTDDALLQCFRELVDSAGFAETGTVIMEMTEGEAAAVFTAKSRDHSFEEGEAFMVCDAGGGTTDMCVMQVKKVQEEMVELESLDCPQAIAVGSVDIDEMFQAIAEEQLRILGVVPEDMARLLAHQITRGEFQALKTRFGKRLVASLKNMQLAIPNSNQRINLSRDQLKAMFDTQIQKIIELIDTEIAFLGAHRPDIRLSSIFLAGGLGSSIYVQEHIVEHCINMKVLFAPKPEDLPLAVCKGLVFDRWQHSSNKLPVIPIRNSNASYGILCKELYSKKKHSAQTYTRNPLDGRNYVEKQIDWLVLKNGRRDECVRRMYSLILTADKIIDTWGFSVVRSTLEPTRLPTSLDGKGGATVICHVIADPEADLHDAISSRRRTLTGKKFVFSQVNCELSADIRVGKMEFGIRLTGEGNGTPQALKVQWEENNRLAGREIDGLVRLAVR
ncbi:uncharacterized protein PAC_05742 [Phialocephala subalpina]|uniref:Hsp70 protein n=1 Tax=Phialocephala subalpina TaxID=576137 RepID=A0A1L7WSW0_9HELO|nr:uncharacterized protein PAC_05742 [Phialocephala subalpina]